MFQFLRALEIDTAAGSARAEAVFDSGHPLLADHFPHQAILPGSWLVEVGAQVAGLLCEEVFAREIGVRRWAILGMIRNATFLRPTPLPATLEISVEIVRREEGFCPTRVEVLVAGRPHMRAELVMTMNDAGEEWDSAIEARGERIQRILRGYGS